METVYTKRFIKTEDDLPKVNGIYSVHTRGDINKFMYHDSTWMKLYTNSWLRDYDWYLEPRELPTDEMIEKHADNLYAEADRSNERYYGFIKGAKAMRDGKIK